MIVIVAKVKCDHWAGCAETCEVSLNLTFIQDLDLPRLSVPSLPDGWRSDHDGDYICPTHNKVNSP